MTPLRVVYSERALEDIERFAEFLSSGAPEQAELVVSLLTSAIETLRDHPYTGRPVRGPIRELVISHGRTGYVALYRVSGARVEILTLRHQREAGYL